MTNHERIVLDIERAGKLLHYLFDNPSEMEKIPSGSNIRFVDDFEDSNTILTASNSQDLPKFVIF
ncbi:MAG: hypothetical protein FWC26_15255 [Fibromonadales bacterium]|nr:hypothetical protein [Fibromonadales bacterium]